jgi:hypothetical protein
MTFFLKPLILVVSVQINVLLIPKCFKFLSYNNYKLVNSFSHH